MIKHKNISLLLLVMKCFMCGGVAAQQPSGQGSFKLFFEKVYLHTDRDEYISGDNIWFKAYLVNAQSNYSTNSSKNLYVELVDPNNAIALREVLRIEDGVAAGDFRLEDSIAGGTYRIRAYTNWMRNFGYHFIFEKSIYISPGKGYAAKTSIQEHSTAQAAASPLAPAGSIQFEPEGGTLVEGVSTTVAFKAEGYNGKGIPANGYLLASTGDTAARFATAWAGMGIFTFQPQPGIQYTAMVRYGNGPFVRTGFPEIFTDGFVMNIAKADSGNVIINIRTNQKTASAHPTGEMTIAGRHGGKVYYAEKVFVKEGKATVAADRNVFPEGVASFTLYDEKLHPQCERLVYISKHDAVQLTVSADKPQYASREKATVHISVTGVGQQPVKSILSMAVVDAGVVDQPHGNIAAYLMLQSELSGRIENPAQYFDRSNTRRFEQLDLLMRTQGWRSFLWQQLADTTIHISYLPEPGITVSGSVKTVFGNKPLRAMNITLYAPGATGTTLFSAKTDSAGRYYVDGLTLYGNQTINVNAKNNKGKKGGLIQIDNLFNDPLQVNRNNGNSAVNLPDEQHFADEAYWRKELLNKDTSLYSLLPGVTVKRKTQAVVLRDGSAYAPFGYPEYDFTITEKDYKYQTLEDFLVHNIPGAEADVEYEGVTFIANGKTVRPRFIVDKKEDVFERLDYYTVPMNQINSVKVRHLVGPPTYNVNLIDARKSIGADVSDVFLVYLSLKPGAYNNDLSVSSSEVTGYYESRIFFAPVHPLQDDLTSPDLRTTIHWEPFIVTDINGKADIQFYNADPKTLINILVEGITENGSPVSGRASYQVK